MMMPTAKYHEDYVGPRAIFDQDFIPPTILHRQKEERSLFSMIKDSFTDNFSINILYQGIEGIGKKVIINKVVRDLNNFHDNNVNMWKIKVNCQEKNLEEIII
jgi:Cdc6-like AAA superfamily ATPase